MQIADARGSGRVREVRAMSKWRVLLALLVLLLVVGQPLFRRGGLGSWVSFGRDVTLAAGQRLDGHMVAFGGNVIVGPGAAVHGDVLALGGGISIAGQVDGQAFAPSGDITLAETARVAGDVLASGGVLRRAGAVVHGEVMGGRGSPQAPLLSRWRERCLLSLPSFWFGWPWGIGMAGNLFVWALQVLLGSLVVVALGLLVLTIASGPAERASHALRRHPWQSVAAGLLAWLVAVVGVPLLASTVIGIPLAAAIVIALAAGLLFAWLPAGLAVGQQALTGRRGGHEPLLAATVGLAILATLTSIPCVGFIVIGAIGVWGLGAVVVTRFGTTPYRERSSI